ncbi:hypothetical protein BS47DRAFT_438215 [Hydnum rufescens UP504]|uniref:Peroxisomal membrane protein PEX16 n=1 Tax=Hydnum rufescens UP504 TaxID=1448309 RepID=A0A9P6AK40_9AGAM|nr:hypothetical protein BS47DRAFT_438215 [Hydnum rufescens UP504]
MAVKKEANKRTWYRDQTTTMTQVKDTLSPIARYESFLVHNSTIIGTIESSLRSLSWFLPGKFKDADLASESLTTVLNLISLYHDTLLARRFVGDKSTPLIPPSDHSRYTRAWTEKRVRYKHVARALEVIRYLQLVIEMYLRRRGADRAAWRGILTLEAIKVMLRLSLLWITRRPLVHPPIPERDLDPIVVGEAVARTKQETVSPHGPPHTPDHIKNNRLFPPTPPSQPSPVLSPASGLDRLPVDDFLLSKALKPSSVCPPILLVRPLTTPTDWFSEVLHILRPFIYVIAASRLVPSEDSRSGPIFVSIALDILSRYLRRNSNATRSVERSEYARRDREMLWYLLRGAVWESYTRPKILYLIGGMNRTPILGLFSALLRDWIPLIDEYHYYTSA